MRRRFDHYYFPDRQERCPQCHRTIRIGVGVHFSSSCVEDEQKEVVRYFLHPACVCVNDRVDPGTWQCELFG